MYKIPLYSRFPGGLAWQRRLVNRLAQLTSAQ
jgi:hypothetical protein